MTKKLTGRSEFPECFQIQNYDICAGWDLGFWAANLQRRAILRQNIVDCLMPTVDEKHLKILQEATKDFLSGPEMAGSSDTEGEFWGTGRQWPAFSIRVRDLSAMDFLGFGEIAHDPYFDKYISLYKLANTLQWHPDFIPEKEVEKSRDALEAIQTLETMPEWQMFEDIDGEMFPSEIRSPFALAEIDLNASDEDLVSDFRVWLQTARNNRKLQSAANSFSQAEAQQWVKMKVLAYIDLSLWLLANDRRATNQVIGVALFPDEFDIGLGERVRKTVADYANTLMKPNVIRAIQSQFLKTEREKQNNVPEFKKR